MKKVILKIGGMSCSACSSHVEKYLKKADGVIDATVNLVMAQALVTYEDDLTIEDLGRYIKESGYEFLGVYDEKAELKKEKTSVIPFLILGAIAIFLMYFSMGHMFGLPEVLSKHDFPILYALIEMLLVIPFLFYGFDILLSGIRNMIHRSPNMDTLVSIGVIANFLYSFYGFVMICLGNVSYLEQLYFESSAIILYFIKIGRYIDHQSKEKTKKAIQELVQITPSKAYVKKGKEVVELSIDEVKKDDILVAKPGMKIAVDGVVKKGSTHVDESFITGESKPGKKETGSFVVAGSMNLDGYIEYQAKRIGRDSTISEIVRLVVEATNTKAPISRLADRVSGYFVPSLIFLAGIVFLLFLLLGVSFSSALNTFVTILVVACPCALGLATPLAIVVSEGTCARKGILVKTSEILENAHKVDTIVFDKTGTLTYGNLRVNEVNTYSQIPAKEVLRYAASLEAKSNHPISKAFGEYARENALSLEEISSFQTIDGIGVKGLLQHKEIYAGNYKLFSLLKMKNPYEEEEKKLSELGNSIVYVIYDGTVIGLIGVKDIVRTDAKQTVQSLKKLGKEVVMLTGDRYETAKVIADAIGITAIKADVMPQEKAEYITELMKTKQVMMVGDGINDAPSLAKAHIGISVNHGTDIAADSSDVILMNDHLDNILSFLQISKKTIRIIEQNLFWAFFYNLLMIPLAIGLFSPWGFHINPMFASLAMTISSLTVVFNSLRLRR